MFYPLLPGNPCANYTYQNLTNGDRAVSFIGHMDHCDDVDITNWDIWYRVSGDAGNALASKTSPPRDSCGTRTRMYLVDDHPAYGDGEVTQKACASKSPSKACNNQKYIKVINCGAFYLYKLCTLRQCITTTWAYCTNGQGMYYRFLYVVRNSFFC